MNYALMVVGEKYLVSTDNWFVAPDGTQYRAVYGTVHAILEDNTLGIKTNRNSTNWYIHIGNMVVAGCQIHYAIRTDHCHLGQTKVITDDKQESIIRDSIVYNADEQGENK